MARSRYTLTKPEDALLLAVTTEAWVARAVSAGLSVAEVERPVLRGDGWVLG